MDMKDLEKKQTAIKKHVSNLDSAWKSNLVCKHLVIALLIIIRTDHNNTMLASWLTIAIKMFSPPVRTIVRRAIKRKKL